MSILGDIKAIGDIHPLVVHFPIALGTVAFLFEMLFFKNEDVKYHIFSTWLVYLASFSAVIAAISGYFAAETLGHDTPGHELVHLHRNIMLWMTGVLVLTSTILILGGRLRRGIRKYLKIILLFIVSVLIISGADKGGQMVYKYGFGVGRSPETTVSFETIEGTNYPESEIDRDDPPEENDNHNSADHSH